MVNNWCTCDDRESQLMWIFFGLKMALQLSLYSHLVSCALEVFQTHCVHVQTRWMGTSMRTTSWMVSDPLKVVVPWELDSCMMCIQTTWSLLLWKKCEVEIGCYSRTVKELLGEGYAIGKTARFYLAALSGVQNHVARLLLQALYSAFLWVQIQ